MLHIVTWPSRNVWGQESRQEKLLASDNLADREHRMWCHPFWQACATHSRIYSLPAASPPEVNHCNVWERGFPFGGSSLPSHLRNRTVTIHRFEFGTCHQGAAGQEGSKTEMMVIGAPLVCPLSFIKNYGNMTYLIHLLPAWMYRWCLVQLPVSLLSASSILCFLKINFCPPLKRREHEINFDWLTADGWCLIITGEMYISCWEKIEGALSVVKAQLKIPLG